MLWLPLLVRQQADDDYQTRQTEAQQAQTAMQINATGDY